MRRRSHAAARYSRRTRQSCGDPHKSAWIPWWPRLRTCRAAQRSRPRAGRMPSCDASFTTRSRNLKVESLCCINASVELHTATACSRFLTSHACYVDLQYQQKATFAFSAACGHYWARKRNLPSCQVAICSSWVSYKIHFFNHVLLNLN